MGLSCMWRPSRSRYQRGDQYQASRPIPAEMFKSYRVGRPESHAYEKSATALSVGIPRHNVKRLAVGECQEKLFYEKKKTQRNAWITTFLARSENRCQFSTARRRLAGSGT